MAAVRTNPDAEALIGSKPTRVIQGDGYMVKIFQPFVIRYYARGKQVTFSLELLKKEGSWWIFGSYWGVYVELPLCWDDEDEPVGVRTAEMIVSQIKEALESAGGEKYYKLISVQGRAGEKG